MNPVNDDNNIYVDMSNLGCGIAIGETAQDKSEWTNPGEIVIGHLNLTDLEAKVEKLEEIVKQQAEMLNTLWYHPGMPGYSEAHKQYEIDSQLLM